MSAVTVAGQARAQDPPPPGSALWKRGPQRGVSLPGKGRQTSEGSGEASRCSSDPDTPGMKPSFTSQNPPVTGRPWDWLWARQGLDSPEPQGSSGRTAGVWVAGRRRLLAPRYPLGLSTPAWTLPALLWALDTWLSPNTGDLKRGQGRRAAAEWGGWTHSRGSCTTGTPVPTQDPNTAWSPPRLFPVPMSQRPCCGHGGWAQHWV